MQTLTPEIRSEFLDRFYPFGDAAIRRVEHRYLADGTQQMTVELTAQDQQAIQKWSNVLFRIDNVSEFLFREGKSTCVVMSEELSLQWIEGQVWCAFAPYFAEQTTPEDFRRSMFYVVGSTILWQVLPYSKE